MRAARRRARPPARRARARAHRGDRREGGAAARARARRRAPRGFARELLRLVDELEELRVTPQRLTQALRAWAGGTPAGAPTPTRSAALYAGYRRRLERLGRLDAPLYEAAALDALRETPAAWGETPVFFYGFDDLQPLQRDAVETLAAHRRRGHALARPTSPAGWRSPAARRRSPSSTARASSTARSKPAPSTTRRHRGPRCTTSSAASSSSTRRQLFDPDPVDPGAAVTLLQGGGERAELELVAAEAARLIAADGVAPEEIAVVLRAPGEHAALLTEVFGAFGVPVALDRARRVRPHAARARPRRPRCAARCPTAAPTTCSPTCAPPGCCSAPSSPTGSRRARARRARGRPTRRARCGRSSAGRSRRSTACAPRSGAAAPSCPSASPPSCRRCSPRRGAARRRCSRGAEAQDVAVLRAGRAALEQLATLARADRALAPTPDELAALLHDLDVFVGTRPGPGPRHRRRAARRCARAACGSCSPAACRRAIFPAAPRTEPFFADTEREQIAAASGLRLRRRDELGAERYLFYATVSRPEERLYLSWHEAGDDGEQAVRSFFVSDVCDLFGPELEQRRRTRSLGEVGWPDGAAPSERERLRGEAASGPRRREAPVAPLRDEQLVARLRDRAAWSASGIELWASCPVKWFVERMLKPEGLTPDPEALLRGALTHSVLEAVVRGLIETTGSGRLDAATLPAARELAAAAIERFEGTEQIDDVARPQPPARDGAPPARRRAALPRARRDVRLGARAGRRSRSTSAGPTTPHRAARAARRRAAARAHRPHRHAAPTATALVYDYKGRMTVESANWRAKRKYQVALYMLAARDVLGLDPVGGLYQPIGGRDQRARGLAARRRRSRPDGRAHRPPRRRTSSTRSSTACSRTCSPRSTSCAPARSQPRPADLHVQRQGLRVPDDLPLRGGSVSAVRDPRRSSAPAAARSPRSSPRPSAAATARCCSRPTPAAARRRCSSSASCARCSRTACARRGSSRSRSPSAPPASCARGCASASSSSAAATQARETEAAWVSTIHGFCTRVLRAHAIAAGLDPAFTVLDEAAARPLHDRAWDAALARLLDGANAAAALDLVAAYDADRLRTAIAMAHDALRSAGQTRPRLPRPRGLADPHVLRAPLEAAVRRGGRRARARRRRHDRQRRARAPRALRASCSPRRRPARSPRRSARLTLGTGANALKTPACDALPRRARGLRVRPAATPAPPPRWRCSTSCWATTPTPTPRPSARARRSTSTTSSCTRATCSTREPALRSSYAERFDRVMVDELQDSNPLQLELFRALDRDDLFLVGDEQQSIYGFRHADVDVFRELRAQFAADGRVATLATNFRSHGAILDTINAAFAPRLGDGLRRAARGPRHRARDARRSSSC